MKNERSCGSKVVGFATRRSDELSLEVDMCDDKDEVESLEADWGDRFGTTDDSFIEELTLKDKNFAKRLSGFLAGDVTMSDGSEHELLASIASQAVDDLKFPTERQRSAFKKVYESLLDKKRAGEEVRCETDSEKEKRAKSSAKLVRIARKHIHKWPGKKTGDIINSMASQFDKKGSLSKKQVSYLTWIVEQRPPKILLEETKGDGFDD